MRGTIEQSVEAERLIGVDAGRPIGPWRMRQLAARWGRAPVRAAAFTRRPDYVKSGLDIAGIPELSARVALPPELREFPNAAVRALPDRQLLVLDQLGILHLIGLKGWIIGRLGDELMQWPVRDVTVTVIPGKKKFRGVRIVSGETQLLLAGPWSRHQRQALQLIERETKSSRESGG